MAVIKWVGLIVLFIVATALFFLSDALWSLGYYLWIRIAGVVTLALAVLLVFPIFSQCFPPKISFNKKFGIYLLLVGIVLGVSLYVNKLKDPSDTLAHYQSRFGNCSQFLGYFWKSNAGASIINTLSDLFDARIQTLYYSGEDVCRSINFVHEIQRPNSRLCTDVETPTPLGCLNNRLSELNQTQPFTTLGALIFSATAFSHLYQLKGGHNTVSEASPAKETSPEQSKIHDNLTALETLIAVLDVIQNRAKPEDLIPEVSASDLDRVPPEILLSMFAQQSDPHSTPWDALETVFENRDQDKKIVHGILVALDRLLAHGVSLDLIKSTQDAIEIFEDRFSNQLRKLASDEPNIPKRIQNIKQTLHTRTQELQKLDPRILWKQRLPQK